MGKLLDGINTPADLRKLEIEDLPRVAYEIRHEIISIISEVGGHFASTLGAVELTLALHYAFNTPVDRLVWDTGHQAYAHKIICGRRDRLPMIRQLGGLSGFLSREESSYDIFGAGHAGTAVSAALGMVVAGRLQQKTHKTIAVISDGGLTAGLTLEGLNQAGCLSHDLIVVLNDNEIFIDPKVGGISEFLSTQSVVDFGLTLQTNLNRLRSRPSTNSDFYYLTRKLKEAFRATWNPGSLFESLGFGYVGPIDGYNLPEMVQSFRNAANRRRPLLVHVKTKKGKGYPPAEQQPIKYHSVSPFHVLTGKSKKEKSRVPTYTEIFTRALIRLSKENPNIVAITAAMGSGTGIDKFMQDLPGRGYDVGIAEQHAVTFAAGLAAEGLIPVVAIYSTFLQRAYDQIVHDVCLQNLHVVFAVDRGGLVGADGPTHHGVFDFAYLRHIPNMTIMAPMDENELQHMVKTAVQHHGPVCLRYPRGEGWGVDLESEMRALEIGQAELLRPGKDLVIAGIGETVLPALRAARDLSGLGIDAAVINARFLKPLDRELLCETVLRTPYLITVEDHVLQAGFGSSVIELLSDARINGVQVRRLGVPDRFIPQGSQEELRRLCAIDQQAIFQTAIQMINENKSKLARQRMQ